MEETILVCFGAIIWLIGCGVFIKRAIEQFRWDKKRAEYRPLRENIANFALDTFVMLLSGLIALAVIATVVYVTKTA